MSDDGSADTYRPRRLRYRARFDNGIEIELTEWHEEGRIDREITYRSPGLAWMPPTDLTLTDDD
jgi:hypothetical protein